MDTEEQMASYLPAATVNINNKNYSITVVHGSGSLKVSDILDASNYIAVANYSDRKSVV